MATIRYGQHIFQADDQHAGALRNLVRAILRKGETEWYPFEMTRPDMKKVAIDLLITPGVPIIVESDDFESIQAVQARLGEKYLSGDDEESVPD